MNKQKKRGCPRSLIAVDLRSRLLAFSGACGEPYRRERYFLAQAPAGVSPVTLVPQDKEGSGSFLSHEENVKFIFEESRTLHSNQLFIEDFSRQRSCLKVNFRLSGQPPYKLLRLLLSFLKS
ncbi:hypothetical protein [Fictibacillus sp. KU28468]|uniref:hypothetical protein n=1 Tax=Fictibacillus sp. KU28468 TaxID=2991053 RepID=UPI00223D346C|nr:hypothetical protein [Fictibacillus sp. KU28468]UZJ78499.1 hypothetical protein OKX00_20625 [Fictibacillus sp. KU28468]